MVLVRALCLCEDEGNDSPQHTFGASIAFPQGSDTFRSVLLDPDDSPTAIGTGRPVISHEAPSVALQPHSASSGRFEIQVREPERPYVHMYQRPRLGDVTMLKEPVYGWGSWLLLEQAVYIWS